MTDATDSYNAWCERGEYSEYGPDDVYLHSDGIVLVAGEETPFHWEHWPYQGVVVTFRGVTALKTCKDAYEARRWIASHVR